MCGRASGLGLLGAICALLIAALLTGGALAGSAHAVVASSGREVRPRLGGQLAGRANEPAAVMVGIVRDFRRLRAQLPGSVGVVFGAPGGDAVQLGDLLTDVAWSTMKVPVAVAYARMHGGIDGTVVRAITISDNAAAMSLWSSLAETAVDRVARVQSVLADGGDKKTRVQGYVVRPGFTPFGQTEWSLRDQQIFAAYLPCVRGSAAVRDLMGRIDPSQKWGLGQLGVQSRFKGGWGPTRKGGYLVRQFGLISIPSGEVAVAIAARPVDGSFASGVRYLDLLATFVAAHATGGRMACPGLRPSP